MIEVNIGIEPLDGSVVLTRVLEGHVDGSEVLHAALSGDEGVGRSHDSVVSELDSKREPDVFALGVKSVRDVQIGINFGHDFYGHRASSGVQALKEDLAER